MLVEKSQDVQLLLGFLFSNPLDVARLRGGLSLFFPLSFFSLLVFEF